MNTHRYSVSVKTASILLYSVLTLDSFTRFALGQTPPLKLERVDLAQTSTLRVRLTVTNPSRSRLDYTSTNPFSDYRIVVVAQNGTQLVIKEACRALASNTGDFQFQRAILMQLSAGESNVEEFEINECFDLSPFQKVTATASRQFASFQAASVSNPLEAELR